MVIDRATKITTGDRHKRSSHPAARTDNSRPMSDGTKDKSQAISIDVQPTTDQWDSTESNKSVADDSGFFG